MIPSETMPGFLTRCVKYRLSHIRVLSQRHFGADYSQYAVLRRMGFSWLRICSQTGRAGRC